jgi:hypothetical protein
MKHTVPQPPRQGFLARLSGRVKVILAIVLLIGGFFALVLAFGAGLVTGLVIDANRAQSRCDESGGTWDAAERTCAKAAQAPAAQGNRYTCERAGFALEAIDPEIMSVTRGEGGEAEWYSFTGFQGESRTFTGEGGVVTVSGNTATFAESGSGAVVRCTAS